MDRMPNTVMWRLKCSPIQPNNCEALENIYTGRSMKIQRRSFIRQSLLIRTFDLGDVFHYALTACISPVTNTNADWWSTNKRLICFIALAICPLFTLDQHGFYNWYDGGQLRKMESGPCDFYCLSMSVCLFLSVSVYRHLTCLEQIREAMRHISGARKSLILMTKIASTAKATSCRLWYTIWHTHAHTGRETQWKLWAL